MPSETNGIIRFAVCVTRSAALNWSGVSTAVYIGNSRKTRNLLLKVLITELYGEARFTILIRKEQLLI